MDKQIKEMAAIVNKPCFEILNEAGVKDKDCPFPYECNECTARNIYKAGYRKASEVAREIFSELEAIFHSDGFHYFVAMPIFDELKKKYESEGEE